MNMQVMGKPMVSIGGFALACALLGEPTQAYAANSETRFQDWIYKTMTDEIGDTTQHIALSHPVSGSKDGLIIIKCDDQSTRPYASYLTGMFMGLSSDDTKTTYRVDKNVPIEQYWQMGKGHVLNFNRDQVAIMAQQMMAGNKFVIQAYDYEFDLAQHVFSLKGSSAAIGRVMDNCASSDLHSAPVQQSATESYQPVEIYQPQQQPAYTYQPPPAPTSKPRRSITGSTKGMSLEDILGQ